MANERQIEDRTGGATRVNGAPETTEKDEEREEDATGVVVLGDEDGSCSHPPEALERVGIDGDNVYARCTACDAVAVVPFDVLDDAGTVQGVSADV